MSFKRFVEIGRVALIQYGPDEGKLATIVDVIDHNRVLVDGPEPITGVHRHAIGIKRIMLTDIKIAAKHNASQK
jgi:large subunit ribosomal protein L14e